MALRDQPYFPFYVQDYLTDERLLMCSWQTQGIYVRIMCCLHKQDIYGAILFKQNTKQNKSIPGYFAAILCRLIPCQYDEMESAIAELLDNNVLKFDGDKLYQKRMYSDGDVSVKRSKAAKKGGGNPALKSTKKPKNLFKQNHKQNPEYENEYEYNNEEIEGGVGETESTVVVEAKTDETDFENVWTLYGRKGNKKTGRGKWERLTAKNKKAALEHIPDYVLSTPDITYRKNFETYINQEAWNDEIIISDEKTGTNTGTAPFADERFLRGIAEGIRRGQSNRNERGGGN